MHCGGALVMKSTPAVHRFVESTLRCVGGRCGTGQLMRRGMREAVATVQITNSNGTCTRAVSSTCARTAARGAIEVLTEADAPPTTAGGASLATRKKPLNGYLNKVKRVMCAHQSLGGCRQLVLYGTEASEGFGKSSTWVPLETWRLCV